MLEFSVDVSKAMVTGGRLEAASDVKPLLHRMRGHCRTLSNFDRRGAVLLASSTFILTIDMSDGVNPPKPTQS
jgi:hypothetical protein